MGESKNGWAKASIRVYWLQESLNESKCLSSTRKMNAIKNQSEQSLGGSLGRQPARGSAVILRERLFPAEGGEIAERG